MLIHDDVRWKEVAPYVYEAVLTPPEYAMVAHAYWPGGKYRWFWKVVHQQLGVIQRGYAANQYYAETFALDCLADLTDSTILEARQFSSMEVQGG